MLYRLRLPSVGEVHHRTRTRTGARTEVLLEDHCYHHRPMQANQKSIRTLALANPDAALGSARLHQVPARVIREHCSVAQYIKHALNPRPLAAAPTMQQPYQQLEGGFWKFCSEVGTPNTADGTIVIWCDMRWLGPWERRKLLPEKKRREVQAA